MHVIPLKSHVVTARVLCLILLKCHKPLPMTSPHLFPGTGNSTFFTPGMLEGGPLGGGPPRCRD